MTVENQTSKTAKMIMGSSTYDFAFRVLLEDPTEENAKQAIRCVVSDGETETELQYGIDYTVELNADKLGGVVTVTDPKDASYSIVIYRKYQITQGSDYNDYNAFPAETVEQNLDKLTMILQQHDEAIERAVRVTVTDKQTPQELLDDVYQKLDSAEKIAGQAQISADNAAAAVASAEQTLIDVTAYVDQAKEDIDSTKETAISTVNTTKTNAETSINSTKESAIETINTTKTAAETSINSTKTTAETTINTAVSTAETTIQGYIDNAETTVRQIAQEEAQAAIADAASEATAQAKANVDTYVTNTVNPSLQSYVDAARAQATAASGSAGDALTQANRAQAIVDAFDANAATKTTEFNTNAATKKSEVDASAAAAATSASNAAASATAAAGSATAASGSATAASGSATRAETAAASVEASILPSQTGNSGKFLTTNGTTTSWVDVDALPDQTNNYGKVLMTDGTDAHWVDISGAPIVLPERSAGQVLYGYYIDESDPVPATRVHYIEGCDNENFIPCRMDFTSDKFGWGSWGNAFFIPKPCALRYDGTVAYYLDPNDFTKKIDGTASDVRDSSFGGNFMVEFPKIFVKHWTDGNYNYVLISNAKLDDGFECWSCKKGDGSYADSFYMPMFEGTNISNKLRSVATSGKPTASTTAETEATLATANGTGWNTTLWADESLMMDLFPLLFKNTNAQAVLGDGASSSTSALTCNNDAAITRGLMYGTASRAAAGMTYLGMHNWYGHRWRRPNGLMNMNGNYAFKMTHSTIDGSTVEGFNRTGNGYIKTGVTPPAASGSYITRYRPLGDGGKFGLVPTAVDGSATTYYCDGMWTNNGQLDQLLLGAIVIDGALAGAFTFDVSDLPSYSNWIYGASPSYHHL